MIQVDGLGKRFLDYQRGGVSAITDVSFECQPGAIFGLLGPNGAGKTTAMRILCTVLRPTGGVARVGSAEKARLEQLGLRVIDASQQGWGLINHDLFLTNSEVRQVVRRAIAGDEV